MKELKYQFFMFDSIYFRGIKSN